MRILTELIPPLVNVAKERGSERKSEPVGSSNPLENDLSTSPQSYSPALRRDAATSPPANENALAPVEENKAVPVERRKSERRSENRPVLLDTRSRTGRRRASGDVRIDIKV